MRIEYRKIFCYLSFVMAIAFFMEMSVGAMELGGFDVQIFPGEAEDIPVEEELIQKPEEKPQEGSSGFGDVQEITPEVITEAVTGADKKEETKPEAVEKPEKVPEKIKSEAVENSEKIPEEAKPEAVEKPKKIPEEAKPEAVEKPEKVPEKIKSEAVENSEKIPEGAKPEAVEKPEKIPEETKTETTLKAETVPEEMKPETVPVPGNAEETDMSHQEDLSATYPRTIQKFHERIDDLQKLSFVLEGDTAFSVISFRVNGKEVLWHWEKEKLVAEDVKRLEENEIEILILKEGTERFQLLQKKD